MPRWPEQDGRRVARLAFSGPPAAAVSDAAPATFRATFDGGAAAGEEAWLALDGIATSYEVRVNGTAVVADQSMFAAHEVDVTALLRDQGNVVEITCLPLRDVLAAQPRRPRQRWRTKVVENGAALRFVRTSILGRAPGFAPGPPIVGPWRPAWLVRRAAGSVVVEDVALRPRMEGEDGVLAVSARLRVVGGAALATSPIEVEVGPARAILDVDPDGRIRGEARVPGAERWWPHTHGTPALHDVALLVGGERIGLGRTGFRALSPGRSFDADRDALAFAVNGVDVFARGAVWTPVPEDEVRPTLETLRDAGCNIVRLPGIGVPETVAFHDACDELGLLVWQDFMFANLDYPIEDEGFRRRVVEEAEALLAQVAGRPSLAVLCGNSEVEQQAAMFGVGIGGDGSGRGALFGELLPELARAAGADVPYVPSAPCGGALPFHPGTGVANYFGVGGYRRPLSDARTAGVLFASECLALANVPDGEVADGEGVMRDAGADWDFADVREHYRRVLYGDAASPALDRQVSGEVMAHVFGEWRRTASPCGGGIVLWARDLRPGSGWGLLDHRGAPKVALAHLRRAWAPRAVWIVDEGLNGLDVHVANDGPEALEGELHVALLAGGAHAIAEAAEPVRIAAHGALTRNAEAILGRFGDAAYAYRFGPPAHDAVVATLRGADGEAIGQAVHFPVGPPVEREAFALTARRDGEAVVLETDHLAWGVRLDVPGFRPGDDAFVLVPGAPRRVVLRGAGPWRGGRVTALNLIGEAPVSGPDVAA